MKKDNSWKRLLLPAAVLLVSFAISIAAPGNAVRQAEAFVNTGVIDQIASVMQEQKKQVEQNKE